MDYRALQLCDHTTHPALLRSIELALHSGLKGPNTHYSRIKELETLFPLPVRDRRFQSFGKAQTDLSMNAMKNFALELISGPF